LGGAGSPLNQLQMLNDEPPGGYQAREPVGHSLYLPAFPLKL